MATVFKGSVNSTGNGSSYATGAFATDADKVLVVIAVLTDTTTDPLTISDTLGTLTWTSQLQEAVGGGTGRAAIWTAPTGVGSASGAVTVACTGDAATGAFVAVWQVDADTAAALTQLKSGSGTAGTTPTVTFDATTQSDCIIVGMVSNGSSTGAGLTPPSGYTEDVGPAGHGNPSTGFHGWHHDSPGAVSSVANNASSGSGWNIWVVEVNPPTAEVGAELVTAYDGIFADFAAESEDRVAEDSAVQVSVTMDVSWLFAEAPPAETPAEVLVAADVNHQNVEIESLYPRGPPWDDEHSSTLDTSFIFADRQLAGTDSLDVAITDAGSVEVPPAEIAELVAAQPVFPTEELLLDSLDEYAHVTTLDTSFVFADRQVAAADALDVSITDAGSVDTGEVAAELAVSLYTTFQGDVERQVASTWDEYQSTSTLDVSFILADRPITGTDALDVSITDAGAVQVIEGVEQLVAAGYSTFHEPVEFLTPAGLTVEDRNSTTDTSFIFATVNVASTDALDVSITDAGAVGVLAGVVELVAAGYSTFQGMEEALFPAVTENWQVLTPDDPAFMITLFAPPPVIGVVTLLGSSSGTLALQGSYDPTEGMLGSYDSTVDKEGRAG